MLSGFVGPVKARAVMLLISACLAVCSMLWCAVLCRLLLAGTCVPLPPQARCLSCSVMRACACTDLAGVLLAWASCFVY